MRYGRSVGFVRLLSAHGDVVLAVVLAAFYVFEAADAQSGLWRGPGVPLLALPAGLAFIVALAWRRRFPLPVLALAMVPLGLAWTGPQMAPGSYTYALLIALYSVGAHARGRTALLGALGVAVVVAVAVIADLPLIRGPGDVGFLVLVIVGPWAAGVAVGRLRERERGIARHALELERDRDEHVRTATKAERARIARDLHDVVAHAISIIVVQARGGRHIAASDPARARAAFDTIESLGGQALTEMQRMLEMLREGESDQSPPAPQPSLRSVAVLARQVTEAGMPVEVTIDGGPIDLPAGIDVSAYRIVQEALTNALKHAGPATVEVRIRYGSDAVAVEVLDSGRGPGSPRAAESGHGLVGMRERARLYGGSVEAGPRAEGGFAVRAQFPLGRGAT